MSISSLASFGTALRTKGGTWRSGRVQARAAVKRRLSVWPLFRLLGFSVKPGFLLVPREPPVWGHRDARVAHRSQQGSFPRVRTQEFHPQEPTPMGNRDSNLTAQPAPGRALAVTLQATPLLPANENRGPLWNLRSLGRAGSAPGWSNATGRLINSQLRRGRVRLLCTRCWFPLSTFTSHSPNSSVFFKSWRISFIVLSSSLFYSFLSSQLSMQEKEASPHGFLPRFQHFATQAIHVGQEPEQWTSQAVVPPISLSTTFKQGAPGQHSVSWVCLGRSSVGR